MRIESRGILFNRSLKCVYLRSCVATMEQNLISKNTVKARVWTKLKPVRAQTKLTD